MRKFTIFTDPYILIRDQNLKYKPFFKEFKDIKIPKLEFDGRLLGCPFLKEYDGTKSRPNKKKATKIGFCEVCYDRFTNYQKHVITPNHIECANEPNLFKEIDEIIETFKEEDFSTSTFDMTPFSSPTEYKSPDYYNGPTNFLSFMSKKEDPATTIQFIEKSSDINPNKKQKISFNNIDEFVNRIINDSD